MKTNYETVNVNYYLSMLLFFSILFTFYHVTKFDKYIFDSLRLC